MVFIVRFVMVYDTRRVRAVKTFSSVFTLDGNAVAAVCAVQADRAVLAVNHNCRTVCTLNAHFTVFARCSRCAFFTHFDFVAQAVLNNRIACAVVRLGNGDVLSCLEFNSLAVRNILSRITRVCTFACSRLSYPLAHTACRCEAAQVDNSRLSCYVIAVTVYVGKGYLTGCIRRICTRFDVKFIFQVRYLMRYRRARCCTRRRIRRRVRNAVACVVNRRVVTCRIAQLDRLRFYRIQAFYSLVQLNRQRIRAVCYHCDIACRTVEGIRFRFRYAFALNLNQAVELMFVFRRRVVTRKA